MTVIINYLMKIRPVVVTDTARIMFSLYWLIMFMLILIYLSDCDNKLLQINKMLIVYSFTLSQQTQNICITFLQFWTNVEDVGRRCTNVTQIFCVCWAGQGPTIDVGI